ncbi:uncharacterized protein DS421_11g333680 [Arachis hypogaea]|nr:uncharacterized protein DS421_11g333680 [Arachis hypogaea]
MECPVIQPPCHIPSLVGDHNSLKPHENAPNHFVAESEQSNKMENERGDSDTALHLGLPTDVNHKRKATERETFSNESESQVTLP